VVPNSSVSAQSPDASAFRHRCGWVDNPTPANWWLTDRDGEWTIGTQGGEQADGEMPDFGANWVETNGHHGYGCVCMDAVVDTASKRVLRYRQARALVIERCTRDTTLPRR
jgi:hypothetical protein